MNAKCQKKNSITNSIKLSQIQMQISSFLSSKILHANFQNDCITPPIFKFRYIRSMLQKLERSSMMPFYLNLFLCEAKMSSYDYETQKKKRKANNFNIKVDFSSTHLFKKKIISKKTRLIPIHESDTLICT